MLGYNSDFIFSVVDIKYHPTLLFDRFEKPTLEIHRDIINFRHPDKSNTSQVSVRPTNKKKSRQLIIIHIMISPYS